MKIKRIPKEGTTVSRKRLWDAVAEWVENQTKTEGRNVSVQEHQGLGTIVNVIRERGQVTPPPTGCAPPEVDEVTVTFSGIVACECQGSGSESFLGEDLGGLNGSFVLPRTSSTTFQLSRGPLFKVTKWSPNLDCTGSIEFEHESDVLIVAICNPDTEVWTVAIQDQTDFFFAFFGASDTMPIPAEGVCDFPSSFDLFINGSATVTF